MTEMKHFTLPSSDGKSQLHGIRFIPEGQPRGVLQMVHGMVEHIGRYEELGLYLAEAGFAVIGHDHLGHGRTAATREDLGYFADEHGDRCLIQDMYRVTMLAHHLWPGTKVFVLGHSMGSFLLRRYLTIYGEHIDGAVICGTGDVTKQEAGLGLKLSGQICRSKGAHTRSRVLDLMALGQCELAYGNPIRPGSWLSKNEKSVADYTTDPLCGFTFTAGAYRDFFRVLRALAEQKDVDNIPRDLPVLFISGMDDPLGGFMKKVLAVYNRYVEMGMQDTDIFLYPDDRHEILQELDRENVFRDVLRWMEDRL